MDVDIAQVQYFVELITETGDIYELDNAIQTLAWEEQEGQLAQKATITISSHSTENGALIRSLLKINRIIRIHANWGAGVQTVVDFLIVAFCIFVMIKFINNVRKHMEKQQAEEVAAAAPAEPTKEEQLLTEIRDLLKENQEKKQ